MTRRATAASAWQTGSPDGRRRQSAGLFLAVLLLVIVTVGCSSHPGANGDAKGGRGKEAKGSETPLAGLGDLRKVALLTPMTDAGERPVFRWKPVSGATVYSLVVRDESGDPYWAWTGSETSVPLGGGPKALPAGMDGPVIRGNMSWSVVALDSGHSPIAASDLRPVSK